MNYIQRLKALSVSPDPKHRALVQRANANILRAKDVAGAVHIDSALSNVSVQYRNDDYIGELLMPVVSVAKKSDKFFTYNKRDRLQAPDDAVGARARPNEMSENRSTDNYSCADYALMNHVDNDTMLNADAPLNEMIDLTASVADAMALKREIRIATAMTTAANYGGNTAALSGVDRFDNASNVSIISKLQAMVAALWNGAGPSDIVGFCSLDVANAIARNSNILGLFQYTKDGLATMDQVAKYFGMSKILVGSARKDTANEGQTASYSRIWGDSFGCVRVARSPSVRNASFGYTFRFNGDPRSDFWFDPSIGKSGGYYSRIGCSEDHKIVAADTGYLYTTVIN